MSEHINSFKKALKTHQEHVEARNKRVAKFGKSASDPTSKFGAMNLAQNAAG